MANIKKKRKKKTLNVTTSYFNIEYRRIEAFCDVTLCKW